MAATAKISPRSRHGSMPRRVGAGRTAPMPAREYDPLPLARRLVFAASALTQHRTPPAWIALTAVCLHIGVDHDDRADLAALTAQKQGWLTCGGALPHSVCVTAKGWRLKGE